MFHAHTSSMRKYRRLEVRLPAKDKKQLEELLRGGIQPVRVILRAQALRQLAEGQTAPKVASHVCLTAKGVRDIGWRYCQEGLDRALNDKPRPGAQPEESARETQLFPASYAAWLEIADFDFRLIQPVVAFGHAARLHRNRLPHIMQGDRPEARAWYRTVNRKKVKAGIQNHRRS